MEKITRRKMTGAMVAAAVSLPAAAQAQFDWLPRQGGGGRGRGRACIHIDPENPAILYNRMNCEMCGDCIAVCKNIQTVYGFGSPNETFCTWCGQCVANCWNNGLTEKFSLPSVQDAMAKNRKTRKKTFVAITSPAVRVAIGEMFQMPPGTNMQGQVVSALRSVGFDYVFDVSFGADLTTMEEAHELTEMLRTNDSVRPLFSSCCPSWVRFAEKFFPKYVPYISTCKSPILMQGAMIKTYFAKKKNLDPRDIVVVAIAPCTAKKGEITLPDAYAAGKLCGVEKMPDVDFALTTRELGWWLMEEKKTLAELESDTCDSITGQDSGSGVIFGNTGGVTESVLRTVAYNITGKKPLANFLNLAPVRGLDGLRKAEVRIGEYKIRVGIVHGLGVIREVFKVLDALKFDFVEVMACRGGCIGGGGQPKSEIPLSDDLRAKRIRGLYETDQNHAIRFSYENPEIQRVYLDDLGKPGSEKAVKRLHTI
ncbi:MAG: [Fe-Fe] hydrogenase large subunit C-terminal domain-containing protein [Planctomycetia bacterium]|nr:[Fe-Fe] hydrogenase large subunit C-terminal domain-containing protein [Planctomycetia bacterium]